MSASGMSGHPYVCALREAAIMIEIEGVNIGGYPYQGGVDPVAALRQVAPMLADRVWYEVAADIERGMTTRSVAQVFWNAADRLENQLEGDEG